MFCLCAAIAIVGLAIDWKSHVAVIATTAVFLHTPSSKVGVQSLRRNNVKATLAIRLLENRIEKLATCRARLVLWRTIAYSVILLVARSFGLALYAKLQSFSRKLGLHSLDADFAVPTTVVLHLSYFVTGTTRAHRPHALLIFCFPGLRQMRRTLQNDSI